MCSDLHVKRQLCSSSFEHSDFILQHGFQGQIQDLKLVGMQMKRASKQGFRFKLAAGVFHRRLNAMRWLLLAYFQN